MNYNLNDNLSDNSNGAPNTASAPVASPAREGGRRCSAPALLFLLATLLATGVARADPVDWLVKINRAAASLSFSGTFVCVHDGGLETIRVVRRIRDDMVQERLYSLNGAPREIVRDRDNVRFYLPEKNIGVQQYRQAFVGGFPRILPDDLGGFKRHYHFIKGEVGRIADRMAQRIDVLPKDGYRYGYYLWADLETGLLLRSDLVDQDRSVVEQYQFVTIDIDSEINDQALQTVTGQENLMWYRNDHPRLRATPDEPKWRFTRLPDGYRLSKYIRRMAITADREVEHLIFTDGLSTVSVFIKPVTAEQSDVERRARMGAMNVYRKTISGHLMTVMGEVPAQTVKMLGSGATYVP